MPSKKIKTMEMAKIIVIIFPLLLGLLGSWYEGPHLFMVFRFLFGFATTSVW
jgi:hypothetical protein